VVEDKKLFRSHWKAIKQIPRDFVTLELDMDLAYDEYW
jgi:hypothetical protein